jgi:2,3-bisphosphoglycerate-independent phosphoglycerate mutase
VMGNSEVGHLNIGAGRVVEQDIRRIERAIDDGSFPNNAAITRLLDGVRERGGALHLMGLTSDGAVHSHQAHLEALLGIAIERGVSDVLVHAFLDGRDTPPRSAHRYLERLQQTFTGGAPGRVATVSGRYYAMDRDNRWERVERAYRAVVQGDAAAAATAAAAVTANYEAGITDEFVVPTVIGDRRPMTAADGVLFFNYRADRARQLTHAITDHEFDGFARGDRVPVDFVSLTRYDAELSLPIGFPPQQHRGILADALADNQMTNLRVAETEKYAHMTYFFNGGCEAPFTGETRTLIPSARVATYDLQPTMSAGAVTDAILKAVQEPGPDHVICNYANADMVGHTGNLDATVTAVETIDACLGRLVQATDQAGMAFMLTADHGNAEQMLDPNTGEPHTAHTTSPVPFVVRWPGIRTLCSGGRLADVAPTALDLWGVDCPKEMTGRSLLNRE